MSVSNRNNKAVYDVSEILKKGHYKNCTILGKLLLVFDSWMGGVVDYL